MAIIERFRRFLEFENNIKLNHTTNKYNLYIMNKYFNRTKKIYREKIVLNNLNFLGINYTSRPLSINNRQKSGKR